MKVSEFLLEQEVSGQPPLPDDPMVSYWAGWLIGAARGTGTVTTMPEAIAFARRATEFIEEQT